MYILNCLEFYVLFSCIGELDSTMQMSDAELFPSADMPENFLEDSEPYSGILLIITTYLSMIVFFLEFYVYFTLKDTISCKYLWRMCFKKNGPLLLSFQ